MERHGKQCCGGEMVSDTMVCCGEGTYGQAFTWKANMSCCGQTFVRDDQSLCCTSDTRHIKVTVNNQVYYCHKVKHIFIRSRFSK